MGYRFMKQLTMESTRFQLFVRQALIIALSVHTIFLLLFVALNIPMLIIAQVTSIILYMLAIQGESMSVHFSLVAVIPATMTCSR